MVGAVGSGIKSVVGAVGSEIGLITVNADGSEISQSADKIFEVTQLSFPLVIFGNIRELEYTSLIIFSI